MAPERAEGVVQAVVLYNGRLLLISDDDGWVLPSGTPEPGESPAATAARVVYELTGYLVDGTEPVARTGPNGPDAGPPAVVCQLLSESPSDGAALPRGEVRWSAIAETAGLGLPVPVRDYLRGHAVT